MLLSVHITPKSRKNEIIGWSEDAKGQPVLKVKVVAVPEDGKANAELITFLAKQWDIPKSAIEITSGATSRHKRLKIHKDVSGLLPQ